jgi:hypothetical protein
MPELSKDQARASVEGALARLLDPQQHVDQLARYFASDYIQEVDDSRLTFL